VNAILGGASERLDLGPLFWGGLPEVVAGLLLAPDFWVGAEGGGEAQRQFGLDAGFAVGDARKRGAGDLQIFGSGGYIELAQELANDFARVRRSMHTQVVFPGGHPVFRQSLRSLPF